MPHSLFITPIFILVELGFLLCTIAAAYELFIGDFIWAKEEEERRTASKDTLRGRQRPLYSQQRGYHRSLSPRSGRGRVVGQEDETTPLLHGRRFSKRSNDGAVHEEEESYPSPGDLRNVGVRGGSAGDSTRRLFYKLILLSVLARFLLLPLEFYCFERLDIKNSIPLRILLRTSQTLPNIAFASSLGLLVIFCARVSFEALPPLSPRVSDESDDEEATLPAHEVVVCRSIDEENEESPQQLHNKPRERKRKNKTSMTRTIYNCFSRILRTILASKQTFSLWNFAVLTSYSAICVMLATKNGIPVSQTEIYLWTLLTSIYAFLLVALFYVGALLLKALTPGLKRRKDSNALALRLLGTCVVLAWIFIERVISFAVAARTAAVYQDSDTRGERKLYSYRRDAIDYGISELLPVLCLLFMMHRRRRGEQPSDVLIIHSLIHNVFGSMGVLSASEEDQADTDASSAEGGALASRRFQTYGGSRNDSSPGSSTRPLGAGGGMGRATSSSGPPKHPRI